MAIGFGLLGLEPRAFWSLTIAELEAAVRGRFGSRPTEGPPSKADVASLTCRYPDV
jgi:hypothetical protein